MSKCKAVIIITTPQLDSYLKGVYNFSSVSQVVYLLLSV